MADFVNLQAGEKVVKRIKPLPVVKKYWFVTSLLFALLIFGWWVIPMGVVFLAENAGYAAALTVSLALFAVLAAAAWILTVNRFENREYIVTTKRVIYKHGTLGYQVHSVPLERITDVIVSRTFLENWFGFGSVLIQTMAGQVSRGMNGAEASLAAVPEPEKLQETIFELITKKRKNEKLTF